MNSKKYLFPLVLLCTVSALTLRLFAKRTSAKPVSNGTSYEAINTYLEQQMHRLNIPGVSLAIVEGDKIMRLHSFGKARPGGETPSPQTLIITCKSGKLGGVENKPSLRNIE